MSWSVRSCWSIVFVAMLSSAPPGQAQPAEDALPSGVILRMGSMRLRHSAAVDGLAFTPSGQTLISGAADGVKFWEVSTGRLSKQLKHRIGALDISADGRWLALGEERGQLRVWDVAKDQEAWAWPGGTMSFRSVVFSPDSKILASAASDDDSLIRLWDAASGKSIASLKCLPSSASALAFTPDGKKLVSGGGTTQGDTALRLWDVDKGKEIRRFPGHSFEVTSAHVSSDGKHIVSACAGTVRVWDLETGKELAKLNGPSTVAVFKPRVQKIATSGIQVGVWTAPGSEQVATIEAAGVQRLAFSPYGRILATGGKDGQIRLWDPSNGKEKLVGRGHQATVNAVAFSPDGNLVVSGGADHTIRLWGVASGAQLRTWEVPSGGIKGGGDAVGLSFIHDGATIVAGQNDAAIRMWDVATGQLARELEGHERLIADLAVSPNGKHLVTAGGDSVLIQWDAVKGKEVRKLAEGRYPYPYFVAATDTMFASSNGSRRDGSTIQLWDAAKGNLLRSLRESPQDPGRIRLTRDGKHLACAPFFGKPIQLWDTATGNMVREFADTGFDPRERSVTPFAFSPDDKFLAAGIKDDIILFELRSGQKVKTLRGHAKPAAAIAFSPDGRMLVSGSEDTTILLWDLVGKDKAKGKAAIDAAPWWPALAGKDAEEAYEAMGQLVLAGDQAVAFLKGKLQPRAGGDPVMIPQLLRELDSAKAQERDKAARALEDFGEVAAVPLFAALRGKWSLDTRRRLERILEYVHEYPIAPEDLRQRRSVQVVERIGTPEAQKLLARLASGQKAAPLTQEAAAALARLKARATLTPITILTDEELREKRKALAGSRDPVNLPGHAKQIYALAFSPDRKLLASTSGDRILVHDVATGEERHRFDIVEHMPAIAFAPKGNRLTAAGTDGCVRLWDLDKRSGPVEWKRPGDTVLALAWSPDAKHLAAGDAEGRLVLWDAATGKQRFDVKADAEKVTSLAFVADSSAILAGGVTTERDNFGGALIYKQPARLQLWEVPSGKPGRKLNVRGSTLALAPDGKTVVTGGLFRFFAQNHGGGAFVTIRDVSFAQEFRHYWFDLRGHYERRIVRARGSALAAIGPFLVSGAGDPNQGTSVEWATNTMGGWANVDTTVRLWDFYTGQEVFKVANKNATAVALSPDRHTIAWGDDNGGVVVWDLRPRAAAPDKALDLDKLWTELGGSDAAVAWQAQWYLAQRPDVALPFLQKRLRPAPADLDERIRGLVTDLGSEQFKVRDAATRELAKLGQAAELALDEALRAKPSVEAMRRMETLLQKILANGPGADELRALRAIQVLAWMNHPQAADLLRTLANGSPLAPQTHAARAALEPRQ